MKRITPLLVLCMLGAMLALAAPAAAQSAQEPRVNPAEGPPNTLFSFFVPGFRSGERVGVWFNTPDGRIQVLEETVRAGRNGLANWTWQAPRNAREGVWQAVSRGSRSEVQVVLTFTIRADRPAAVAEANVQPRIGTPGARFVFYATGFNTDEAVRYTLLNPAGRPVEFVPDIPRTYNGRVDWSWTSSLRSPAGMWQMIVRGVDSGVQHTIPFELRAPDARARASNVFPGEGRPGALLRFFATTFAPGDRIVLWANRPDGSAVAVEPDKINLINGRADWDWTIPMDAPPGRWEMVARGVPSNTEFVIPFTVLPKP